MLLPSSIPCDGSQAKPFTRYQAGLFVSPPASPPTLSSQSTIDNIMNTCRSLQSLISMATPYDHPALAPAPQMPQLPTPPLAHAPTPMKLRLRSRANNPDTNKSEDAPKTRRRITKRTPPRGVNKRRRAADDDMGRHNESDSDLLDTDSEVESDQLQHQQQQSTDALPACPTTPKRARIAPEQLPLGLERSDFHDVHLLQGGADSELTRPGTSPITETDGIEWSAEDDRILVELVLEKLKLSKEEWLDCAKSLGKDRHAANRRWRSLVINGDVGLKTRSSRRARLHSTWR
ncbi:hypothetical protein PT974_11746 [Cladobotryum mycophilum]|uniref:Myb-like domain-containing protein n=1 Tax=Cladobotryum mycophilum TaxID=491253 RepID=A0ABR0S625_9HYPO